MHTSLQRYATVVRGAMTVIALCTLLLAGVALADGTHGVKVKVENKANNRIEVQTFNANDGDKLVPHKVYYIGRHGSRWAKAHGKGTGRIILLIKSVGAGKYCKDTHGRSWKLMTAYDKDTITIDKCD